MKRALGMLLAAAVAGLTAAPVAVCATEAEEDDTMPSLRGVTIALRAKETTWCVTHRVATVLDAETHKAVGNVAGGRFLRVKRNLRYGGGLCYCGDFTPKGIGRDVIVMSADVYPLTGSPEALSESQRKALRAYYELKGRAAQRASKLSAEAGSASPYYKELLEAYEAHKKKSEQFERLKAAGKFDSDALRRAQYKLSAMKDRVGELNAKHRQWKAENGETKVDPKKDAEYSRLLDEAAALAPKIPGLAL